MLHGELVRTGVVGADVTVTQARELTERCVLAALAAVHEEAGLEHVSRVVKLVGYVRSAAGFTAQAEVMDAASELLVAVFADGGQHARTSIGVSELPLGSPVEVELTVEVRG
jgi:enamine deaminase RidA (YjgF/YER057c/UK114 family)